MRPRWALIAWVVLAVVSLVAIRLVEPDYLALQSAPSALDFVQTLDHPARAVWAAVIDTVLALSYGAVGVLGLQRLGRGTAVALVALLTVCFGAAADVAENIYLVVNIAARDHVTNDDLVLMQVFGSVKWVAALGYLMLAVLVVMEVLRWLEERRAPRRPTR